MLSCLGLKRLEKGSEPGNARRCEFACTWGAERAGQRVNGILQRLPDIMEVMEASIASELTGRTQNGDGTELFQDVGIAKKRCFRAMRFVMWLMLANGLKHTGHLIWWKPKAGQQRRGKSAHIGHVVPIPELFRILRPVPHKDAQVVKKGGCKDNVVVAGQPGRSLCNGLGEGIQPWLVAVLMRWVGLLLKVAGQLYAPKSTIGLSHAGSRAAHLGSRAWSEEAFNLAGEFAQLDATLLETSGIQAESLRPGRFEHGQNTLGGQIVRGPPAEGGEDVFRLGVVLIRRRAIGDKALDVRRGNEFPEGGEVRGRRPGLLNTHTVLSLRGLLLRKAVESAEAPNEVG